MMRIQVDKKGASPEEYLLVLGLFGEEIRRALNEAEARWKPLLLGEYDLGPGGSLRRRAYLLFRRDEGEVEMALLVGGAPEDRCEEEEMDEEVEALAEEWNASP